MIVDTAEPAEELVISHAYPRPLMERPQWMSLNGKWQFVSDNDTSWDVPDQVKWNGTITVPFAPETPASGIGNTCFYRRVWYRRTFEAPKLAPDERLLLHFGAVDYQASVWINGAMACRHGAGYTPFHADITNELNAEGRQEVVVRAEDDPSDLSKPRGKQDWQLEPHSIWYPRTTGIWQTVWLERVNARMDRVLRWTPNLERWEIGFEAGIEGAARRTTAPERPAARGQSSGGRRFVSGGCGRSAPANRAVRSRHRRLPQ